MDKNDDFSIIARLRSVIAEAKTHDIEVNAVTVNADHYDELIADSMNWYYPDGLNSNSVLRIMGVSIRKQECKGCCRHG